MGFPEGAQFTNQALGEGHAPVLAALALADVEPELSGVNVGDFKFDRFADAQAAVINQAQTHAEAFLAQRGERALDLRAGEPQRQGLAAADDPFGKHRPVGVAELLAEEELEGSLTEGHGRAGETLVLAQEQEVVAQLLLGEGGGVAAEMIGQAAHVTDVFLTGGWPEVFEFDKLLEFCEGRIVGFHRGPRMPPNST
jgi:hypothetical protein